MKRRSKPPEPVLNPDGSALIELTRGKFARVDQEDLPLVDGHIWATQVKGHLFYAVTTIKGSARKQMFMHQLIMGFPGKAVDHIDHDGLNNRRSNLRVVSDTQNQANQQKRRGVSQYKGVCRATSTKSERWQAAINVDGKRKYLGLFSTEEEAARAYDAAALEVYGAYAALNLQEGR